MSTRCQVVVEGSEVSIYRHSDGYPDGEGGVLADLLPLLADFKQYRGWDVESLSAQICWKFVNTVRTDSQEFRELRLKEDPNANVDSYSQFKLIGVCVEAYDGTLHGDLAYIYLAKPDLVEVRQPVNGPSRKFCNQPHILNTKVIRRVRYDGTVIETAKRSVKSSKFKPGKSKADRVLV